MNSAVPKSYFCETLPSFVFQQGIKVAFVWWGNYFCPRTQHLKDRSLWPKHHSGDKSQCGAQTKKWKDWEESQHWAGSTPVQGCPKVIFAKWPTLWPINNLQWAWNVENANFYGFTSPIQTIPRDVTLQKKSDGNCSYKGDMSNIKVADCSKYVLHLRHLTSAEKEWRGDHMGGVILVRGRLSVQNHRF